MAKETHRQWQPVDESLGIYETLYRVPGFKARTTALRLKSGGFLLYSPGPGTLESFERELLPQGEAEVLVAPNGYHHVGIPAWSKRFPNALKLATSNAIKRLNKKGHQDFQVIDAVRERLPDHLQILLPESLKIGEIWIRIQTAEGVAWLICDAFFNFPRVPNGFFWRVLSKVMANSPGLRMSNLIKWFCLGDPETYKAWILERLEKDRPVKLIVCHGDNLSGEDLGDKIRAALAEKIP